MSRYKDFKNGERERERGREGDRDRQTEGERKREREMSHAAIIRHRVLMPSCSFCTKGLFVCVARRHCIKEK